MVIKSAEEGSQMLLEVAQTLDIVADLQPSIKGRERIQSLIAKIDFVSCFLHEQAIEKRYSEE